MALAALVAALLICPIFFAPKAWASTESCTALLVASNPDELDDQELQRVVEEMHSGLPVTQEDLVHYRGALRLQRLMSDGVVYRAIAESFFVDGFKDEKKVTLGLVGFKALDLAERGQIAEQIYQKLKDLAGANLTRTDLLRLDQLAESLGLNADEYAQFVQAARPIFRADAQAAQFAIRLLLESAQPKLIGAVQEQFKYRKYFSQSATIALGSAIELAAGDRIAVKIPVGPFRRESLRVRREIVEEVTARSKESAHINSIRILSNSASLGLMEVQGILWKIYELPSVNYDDFRYILNFSDRSDNVEKMVIYLMQGAVERQKLEPYSQDNALTLLKDFRSHSSRAAFVDFLRQTYPSDSFYQGLLLK